MNKTTSDLEAARLAITGYYQAVSSGDFSRVKPYLLEQGFTEFDVSGGSRVTISPQKLEALFSGPLEMDLKVDHLDVQLMDSVALATYLRIGSIDRQGTGNVPSQTLRVTSVWLNRDNQWHLLHIHNSAFVTAP